MNAEPADTGFSVYRTRYAVRFITPAFLGNASQSSEWRTPPFKALLREWWRVVKANDLLRQGIEPDRLHRELREAEGRLFGHAWLKYQGEHWSARSRVQIGLEQWPMGKLKSWNENLGRINHPEVKRPIDPALYLAYGPLKGTGFKDGTSAAIQAGETNTLRVACNAMDVGELQQALQLASWFGTIGGRSRNGWGSLELDGDGLGCFDILARGTSLTGAVSRPLEECLRLDWPHALGKDGDHLLFWKTSIFSAWQQVIAELARIKVTFRTAFKFDKPLAGDIYERHVLAYPVTNHFVKQWGKQARLANSLRFKVVSTESGYRGIAYHMPCALPRELRHDERVERRLIAVWRRVHTLLDKEMQRITGV